MTTIRAYIEGEEILIDEEHVHLLEKYTWRLFTPPRSRNKYLTRRSNGKLLFFHHAVVGRPPDGMVTDHVNGRSLDNRRSNLAFTSDSSNVQKGILYSSNTSGYKGASWCKRKNRWVANTYVGNKQVHLGSYKTKEEAARAYDAKVREIHGAGAFTNFPQEDKMPKLKFKEVEKREQPDTGITDALKDAFRGLLPGRELLINVPAGMSVRNTRKNLSYMMKKQLKISGYTRYDKVANTIRLGKN
jgi:hypothetical protein